MADIFRSWYYMDYNWRGAGMVHGPFITSQLEELSKTGEITGKTLVRYDNKGPWKPMRDIPPLSRIAMTADSRKRRSEFWRKYKVAIIACLVFAGLFIYRGRTPTSFYVGQGDNAFRYSLSSELLTKDAVIKLANSARAQNGLLQLRENGLLNIIAQARAKNMFEKQYFGTASQGGPQLSDIARNMGYQYKTMKEILARGTFFSNKMIVDNWMQNPDTRKSILSPDVEELGTAVLAGRMNEQDTTIAVLIVGLRHALAQR
jgi:uncharacterized protein YkwD